MASGSQNMTTYNARIVTGSNSAASPAGALLLSGAGRASDATGDTWIFLDSLGGTSAPWGIKHDQANNKIHIYGNNTDSVWTRMDTGDTYILGKVGIGYDPETSGNTYKLYVNGSSFFNDHIYLVADKEFYMQYDNTMYDVLHNHNNGNISVNAASAGLYMAYYNTTFVNWMNGRMELRDGCLSLFPNNNAYRDGMRIHMFNSWSTITLCGADNTGNSGTSANSWFIGNNDGNFYIARNGSPGSTAYIGCVSNVWKFVTAADIPEGAANLSATASAHTLSIYRNGITIPYQMDNVNDGGMLRVRGTAESNCILELGTWDDSGAGETIQFNYYPTTSQITPTYSVSVPKHSGTLVTADGHGVSGTWGISITGNAATATRINGTLGAATSNVNRNIWVSSTAGADGIPNYISYFNMNPSTNVFTVPAGTRISPNAGALYLGNSGNQSWVYVQDMCSQDGQKWKIHQAGSAEFNGTVTAPTFSGNSTTTSKLLDSAHSWTATEVYNYMTARVLKAGDTMTGCLSIKTNTNQGTDTLLYIEQSNNNDWGIKVNKTTSYDYGIQVTCATTAANAVKVSGRITGTTVYGAVWNDYAEFRKGLTTKGGICVYEQENGLTPTITRLQAGCRITSDTFGFAIGETEEAKTPIAVCGRVLVYPYVNRQLYQPGDAVCSAPNGTVDIMTREEIREYPERIVGIVSEIPNYEIWHAGAQDGNHEIQVNGRIWIYVR